MDDTYDIAIVGGGIVGAATFYQLQKKFSNRKLVLIEKEDNGNFQVYLAIADI